MGPTQDKAARKYAVPVRGAIWGLSHNDYTERDIGFIPTYSGLLLLGDYSDYFPAIRQFDGSVVAPVIGAAQQSVLRILQPHYGGIVECYTDIAITVAAADADLTLKLAIGRFSPGTYDRVTTYTQDEIDASWRKIRGSNTPLSVSGGVISASLLDLLPALYPYGNAEYKEDAFVLILSFNKTPTITGTFKFNYLNIHTSVTGVS